MSGVIGKDRIDTLEVLFFDLRFFTGRDGNIYRIGLAIAQFVQNSRLQGV